MLYLCPCLTGQRVGNHDDRVLRQPQGLGPVPRRLREGLRDDRHSRAPPLFGFNPVVETPRGAGASIGHGMDKRIAGTGELI